MVSLLGIKEEIPRLVTHRSLDTKNVKQYIEDIAMICISDLIINRILSEKVILAEPPQYFFDLLGIAPPVENLITPELESKIKDAREYAQNLM